MGKLLFGLVLWGLAATSQAERVTMYLMEIPPLTVNEPERKGVAGDIAMYALSRSGYEVELIVVPSNRALATVAHSSARNLLIIPLARVAARETQYTWIAPLVKVNRAFFSYDKFVRTFGEARAVYRAIGVSRGTAGLHILREEGFAATSIRELNKDQLPPHMLANKRIDAWYGPIAEGRERLLAPDSTRKVYVSPPLGPTYNYLGCSRRCDRQLVERLAATLVAMDKDGTIRAIRERYGEDE